MGEDRFYTQSQQRHTVLVVQPDGGAESRHFRLRMGDGQYPTWLGIDTAGEVVIVLVDFLLTDEGSA